MEHLYDVAIVGGGIAGYTAALTAKTLLLDYLWLGTEGFGALSRAEKITNFPTDAATGEELFYRLTAQKTREGVLLTSARADGVFRAGAGYLLTAREETYSARAVILATGVERRGSLIGEEKFVGKGLSYCAVCDGGLYRGKRVAAVLTDKMFEEDALYLAKFAAVTAFCLYDAPTLSGENITQGTGIPRAVGGKDRVEYLQTDGGKIEADGVFLLKKAVPPAALVRGLKTADGHIEVARDLSTNLAGIYAAGDVTGRPYQYAKAAGEGCIAAHSVKTYLKNSRGA